MPVSTIFDPLSYLIGADDRAPIIDGRLFELSYDASRGQIAYGNLRDEKGRYRDLDDADQRGPYAPYLRGDDITVQYGEYTPDPRGEGYLQNIDRQIVRKKEAGCSIIEWDNPDTPGLKIEDVLAAHDRAAMSGLRTVAKNPLFTRDPEQYLAHDSIELAICEHGDHGSDAMEALRIVVRKPLLAVRFVSYVDEDEDGSTWALNVADNIRSKGYRNMGVTISRRGEYTTVEDLLVPMV